MNGATGALALEESMFLTQAHCLTKPGLYRGFFACSFACEASRQFGC